MVNFWVVPLFHSASNVQFSLLLIVFIKRGIFFHVTCNVTLNLLLNKYSRSARNAVLSFCLVCKGSMYRLISLSEGQ